MNLYVSDLDGTLLNSKGLVTDNTKNILNEVIDKGVNFTVATARTPATVEELLSEVKMNFPVVMMNGVLIYDMKEKKYINIEDLDFDVVDRVLDVFESYKKNCLMYTIRDEHIWVYHRGFDCESSKNFYEERCDKPQKTFEIAENYRNAAKESKVINMIVFGDLETIKSIYKSLKVIDGITVNYYEDMYSKGDYLLDVYSTNASKANAIKKLSSYVDHSKLITFGDNYNDIPMFEISDECYALDNAVDALKKISTGVIGSNDDDAVARFIKKSSEEA